MTLVTLLGVLGNALFIVAALPEAVATIKAGKALGTPLSLIVMVLLGFIAMFWYTYLKLGFDWVLATNYGAQFIVWFILLFYRLFRNKKSVMV